MEERIRELFEARGSSDRNVSYQALVELFEITEKPVTWSYEIWDQMVKDLSHPDGHKRSFAAQLLARLAISDPDSRMLRDFTAVAAVTRDEKTVTARHALQSLWRIGLASPDLAAMVADALEQRFRECASEKNGSLVRSDAVAALRKLADSLKASEISVRALALIDSETDPKAQCKHRAAWRKADTE